MNLRPAILAVSAAISLVALPAGAQSVKPGLWEMNNKMQSNNQEMNQAMEKMRAQMASMPPEQRKMMEEMMAKQGVQMGGGGPGSGMNMKICLTKEQIDRKDYHGRNDGNCKHNYSPSMGSTMKFSFTCTNPPSNGEGEVVFASNEAYSTRMTVNSTHDGKPQQMKMESNARWLGADCGSIKPVGMPKN